MLYTGCVNFANKIVEHKETDDTAPSKGQNA